MRTRSLGSSPPAPRPPTLSWGPFRPATSIPPPNGTISVGYKNFIRCEQAPTHLFSRRFGRASADADSTAR